MSKARVEESSDEETFDETLLEMDAERPENPIEWVRKHKGPKEARHGKINPKAGVIYISRLPDAFAEPQMRKYLSQYGRVQKLKLSRSKKTGLPKGWGWVEFETPEIAEIVAKTLNGYRMFGRSLKVATVPTEKLHKHIWRYCNAKWKPVGQHRVKREIEAQNSANNVATVASERRFKKRVSRENARNEKLKELGVDYKFNCWTEKQEELTKQCDAERSERMASKAKESEEAIKRAASDAQEEIDRVASSRAPKLQAAEEEGARPKEELKQKKKEKRQRDLDVKKAAQVAEEEREDIKLSAVSTESSLKRKADAPVSKKVKSKKVKA